MRVDAFFAACQSGLITDAKTLTGALWLQNHLSGQWPLSWQAAETDGR
jgi:ADP-ribose pyrophosphatase